MIIVHSGYLRREQSVLSEMVFHGKVLRFGSEFMIMVCCFEFMTMVLSL